MTRHSELEAFGATLGGGDAFRLRGAGFAAPPRDFAEAFLPVLRVGVLLMGAETDAQTGRNCGDKRATTYTSRLATFNAFS